MITGLLQEFDHTYNTAAKLFCSDACPCNLVQRPSNSTLVIDVALGAYNIDRCHNESSLALQQLD